MSAAFCESSYKLAQEAKRTQDRLVSPYNKELVQTICRESRWLHNDAETKVIAMRSAPLEDKNKLLTTIMVQHLRIKRNKRVLFAYHRMRTERLKELSWSVALRDELQQDIELSLGGTEQNFLKAYGKLVDSYKENYLELDLGGHGALGLEPPLDPFIEVRVMKDCGRINTEYGTLNLVKGNQEYVRRADVEWLIKAGYLKHVK
ncbi:hypothetical protein BCR43DRAFT_492815 [Syncephalastrum racemosum]|uniref:DNA replication complex GINS protein PSF1 n=1 Tax=Syncephalastrum racemosum TaxID=13706 RepID=A0A1X2H9K9_SYNRA|nr:hypothetical protein BCR43DRAFT_492815 [Syncephalastrum racemosum]